VDGQKARTKASKDKRREGQRQAKTKAGKDKGKEIALLATLNL
jgi:hypothetical protein